MILSHYHRKKFFYRLFLRKSPRAGAMFGLGCLMCLGAILPLAPWLFINTVAKFVDNDLEPLAGQELAGGLGILSFLLFVCLCVLLYAYGFITFAQNFYSILRQTLKKSRLWKVPALIGGWFHELSILLLLPVFIRKRQWTALLLLCGALALGIISFIVSAPVSRWWSAQGCAFLLLCAMGMLKECGKFSWKFMYLLAVFLFFTMSLQFGEKCLKGRIQQKQQELAQVLGCDVSIDGWKERNSTGYPIDQEPLKSFSESQPSEDFPLSLENITQEAARKQLSDLRQAHPDFFQKMAAVLELEPQRIAYKWVEPAAGMLLPDLRSFRASAILLALEMRSEAQDKAIVFRCNQGMLKLRDWNFHNETLIGKLVAFSIERTRLNALNDSIGCGKFTREELTKLIGMAPDLAKQFSMGLPSEIAMNEEFTMVMRHESGNNMKILKSLLDDNAAVCFTRFYQRYSPLFLRMNTRRDRLFSLNHYLKFHGLMYRNDLSALDKTKAARISEVFLISNFFIASFSLLPSLDNIYPRISQIQDDRQMALLAIEIMEYRRRNGQLPQALSFSAANSIGKPGPFAHHV